MASANKDTDRNTPSSTASKGRAPLARPALDPKRQARLYDARTQKLGAASSLSEMTAPSRPSGDPPVRATLSALLGRRRSLLDRGHTTGTNRAATLADREAEARLHGDRLDELNGDLGGVTRHDHVGALGEGDDAGHVRGAEVELRTVVREEGVVAPALFLLEDVDLAR